MLLEFEGCDVDYINRLEGATPLHLAVKIKEPELRAFIVDSLLDAGADMRSGFTLTRSPSLSSLTTVPLVSKTSLVEWRWTTYLTTIQKHETRSAAIRLTLKFQGVTLWKVRISGCTESEPRLICHRLL